MKPRRARFDIREASGRIALVLGALLVANAAVSVLVVRPKVAEYRQLTDESSPHLQVVKTREKDVAAKEAYVASMTKARDDMKRLSLDVLSTRQRRMINVQLEVARLVREFGIALDRVSYENEALDNGALERFGIVVPLNGGYTSLRKFIQAVESSDNFLVIERVALGAGKSADVVELNITLATYFIAADADLDALGKKPIVSGGKS
jgi:Tfp pilus assembly protein PilO